MLRIAFTLLAICLAGPAQPGAWPREKGSAFVSFASYLSWPQDVLTWSSFEPSARYDTLYLEYGLTPRWVIGLDLGRSVSGAAKLVAFARRPLARPEARLQIAPELGLGQIDGQAVLRPGLSFGFGLPKGWLSAELIGEVFRDDGTPDVKIDLTYGRRIGKRTAMLQIQTGQQDGDQAFVRLVPSLVTPLFGPVEAEVGVSYGILGDTSMGLKLGLWTRF